MPQNISDLLERSLSLEQPARQRMAKHMNPGMGYSGAPICLVYRSPDHTGTDRLVDGRNVPDEHAAIGCARPLQPQVAGYRFASCMGQRQDVGATGLVLADPDRSRTPINVVESQANDLLCPQPEIDYTPDHGVGTKPGWHLRPKRCKQSIDVTRRKGFG